MVNMISVSSSNISAIGYEDGNLYVRFHSGKTAVYHGVSQQTYSNLMNAGSKGSYFSAFIKNNYPWNYV